MHPRLEVRTQSARRQTPRPEDVRRALQRADELLAAEEAKRIARRAHRRVRRGFWLALGMACTAGIAALAERAA